MTRKLLNIGCGSTIHPDWHNVDISSNIPNVEIYDLTKGLPYPDNTFEACYNSHFLEHLTPVQAQDILREIFRVLDSDGIARIVVPDLESIALVYLEKLNAVASGCQELEDDYDLLMLELYDQSVRRYTAGYMGDFLSSASLTNKSFIKERLGEEAERYWNREKHLATMRGKLKGKSLPWIFHKAQIVLVEYIILLLAGNKARTAFKEGMFRRSGEVHQWMYDRFSLKRLLENTGFSNVTVRSAEVSEIDSFAAYNLDTFEDGQVRRPNSLIMEGLKS